MKEIVIKKPLNIKLTILEIEEYLPSFKLKIIFEVAHLYKRLNFELEELWFECEKLDSFTNNLKAITLNQKAILSDMSNEFCLSISKMNDNKFLFELMCNEPSSKTYNGNFSFNYYNEMQYVDFTSMVESFENLGNLTS